MPQAIVSYAAPEWNQGKFNGFREFTLNFGTKQALEDWIAANPIEAAKAYIRDDTGRQIYFTLSATVSYVNNTGSFVNINGGPVP